MKRIPLDIIGNGVLAIIAVLLSLTLLTERTDTPPGEAVALFWLFLIANVALSYGRKRIEENHPKAFLELGQPSSIYQSALSKSYWKLIKHIFTLEFLKLRDPKVSFSFSGFLVLSAACLTLLTMI